MKSLKINLIKSKISQISEIEFILNFYTVKRKEYSLEHTYFIMQIKNMYRFKRTHPDQRSILKIIIYFLLFFFKFCIFVICLTLIYILLFKKIINFLSFCFLLVFLLLQFSSHFPRFFHIKSRSIFKRISCLCSQ